MVRWIVTYLVGFVILSSSAFADNYSAEQVKLGEYLARIGNCKSCHTRPGGDDFTGGLAFETPFGVIYSTNITPDEETGIGAWTEDDFLRAFREGVSAKGHNLYPVFPYTSYQNVSDADIQAIYAYMKTVPEVSYTAPNNDLSFPYNQRGLLSIWKALYLEDSQYHEDPKRSAEVNRGGYLVEGLGHCAACHTPRNSLGASIKEEAFAGGAYQDTVKGNKHREWFAVNLTSGSAGLAAWSSEDIADYLTKGYNKHAATFGPMNEVIANSTRHLARQDALAIGAYIKSLPPKGEQQVLPEPDADRLRAGSFIYDAQCGTCHLPTGLGSKDTGPPLKGNPVVLSGNPASFLNIILYGAHVPSELSLPKGWTGMKAYGAKLGDDEIADLATYVRNSWGNEAGAVTEEQVIRQR